MDYAKFAIIVWILFTIVIAIIAKKPIFKQFGIPQDKWRRMDWRAYLFMAMILGAFISAGITFLLKSVSGHS
jgi:hypothetical protein